MPSNLPAVLLSGGAVIDLDGSPHTGASAATVSAAPDLVRPLVELFAKAG